VASLFECEGNYALDRLDELLSKENSENVLFAVLTCFSKSDSQKVFAIIQKHFGSFPQKISSFAEQILARKSALGDSLESGIQTKANS
ncbi:hypothetical protein HYY75_11955, partial [bacterium]|nr:hypothetical protein [bacterium]